MYPSIVKVVNQDSRIKELLTSPATENSAEIVRFLAWGDAGQNMTLPYATWQIISGHPEHYLGNRPDVDSYSIQVDVYANSDADAIAVAEAIRDAVENQLDVGYIDAWRDWDKDPVTGNRHIGFDVGWVQDRNSNSV